jgi:hypothetical protein
MAAGATIVWRARDRDRWLEAIAPLALAAGFLAGYGAALEFPRTWLAEAWKMGVVVAAVAGILLTIEAMLTRRGMWQGLRIGLLAALVAVATWLTVRRFTTHQTYYAVALAGGLVIHLANLHGPLRDERRLWAIGPLVMLISCMAVTLVTLAWVDLNTMGRMIVTTTALAGLALGAGVTKLPALARGSGPFLVVMFGVMLTIIARYRGASIPWWIFAWLGAAPLAIAVAWIPALRKRPGLCVLVALIVALAIVTPAVIVAMTRAAVEYDY